jgi:hypothetical protein
MRNRRGCIKGPASRTASVIALQSPLLVLANEMLHQLIPVALQVFDGMLPQPGCQDLKICLLGSAPEPAGPRKQEVRPWLLLLTCFCTFDPFASSIFCSGVSRVPSRRTISQCLCSGVGHGAEVRHLGIHLSFFKVGVGRTP